MSSLKNYSQIIQNLWRKIKLEVAFICNFICPEASLTPEKQKLMQETKLLLKIDVGLLDYTRQHSNWYINNTLTIICYNYIGHKLKTKSGNLRHQHQVSNSSLALNRNSLIPLFILLDVYGRSYLSAPVYGTPYTLVTSLEPCTEQLVEQKMLVF